MGNERMNNGHAGHAEWVRGTLLRYEGDLTRYARRIVGDDETARDVVQETFLRLCRETEPNLDGHLVEWLYTVCRNKALDVRRKEQRMTTIAEEFLIERLATEPTPFDLTEQRDAAGHILSLLDRLPALQQEAIRLKFQSGLTYREIARVMEQSVSHVGVLIHTGLKTLRERVCRENAKLI